MYVYVCFFRIHPNTKHGKFSQKFTYTDLHGKIFSIYNVPKNFFPAKKRKEKKIQIHANYVPVLVLLTIP